MKPTNRLLPLILLSIFVSIPLFAETEDSYSTDSVLIPKREVGQPDFLKANPTWDGRGVVIAIFDTGVDPAAVGLSETSDGKRKILNIFDASGSGDVDTSFTAETNNDGTLNGLSGKTLTLPENVTNPDGTFRLGLKMAGHIFPDYALERLKAHEAKLWRAELSQIRTERQREQKAQDRSFEKKAPEDRTLEENEQATRESLLETLEDNYAEDGPPICFDCVGWHDGENWQVIVDTDRDGDLTDEKILKPFGIEGDYDAFDSVSNLSFGVQVYEEGDLLSIVTVSGTHGSHVAAIAAAHDPENPDRNGIAPGAQIVSIRIGDPRTGGSSYGTSERRAVALAAQSKADLMNASWGGPSYYQDGKDGYSKSYDILTEKYGIFSLISAGNNGPALSTLGKAGGVSHWALGVGAYVSPEMGKVLYNTLEETEADTLQFSSRGPSKDGDRGVNIMAPGAAFASYSRESLRGFRMINGTSMSAPSATGVAALIKSAAKQEGLLSDPARMFAAITLGAKPIPGVDVSTQGAGLINVEGAWEKLKAIQDEAAFGAYYSIEVEGGTFASQGRGLYLREPDPDQRKRIGIDVTPRWTEATTPEEKVAFKSTLTLRSTVDWIEVPETVVLSNGSEFFAAYLTTPEPTADSVGSYFTGEIEAFLEGNEELGPVFTIPFTIVRGADVAHGEKETFERKVQLSPAQTERWFLNAPKGADKLKVTLKHLSEDPVSRLFIAHGVTMAQEIHQTEYYDRNYLRLDADEEHTLWLPTHGGQIMELALYQFWSSIGEAALDVELEWHGLGLSPLASIFTQNADFASLPLQSLHDQSVKPKAKVEYSLHHYMPVKTDLVPFDERGELPVSPQTDQVVRQMRQRQVFELSFEEPFNAALVRPTPYDFGEFFGGGLTEIIHESGKRLYHGMPWDEGKIEFPKGKTYAILHYDQAEGEKLDQTEILRLSLRHSLEDPQSLPVFENLRARYEGSPADTLELEAGQPEIIYLKDTGLKKLAELKPAPSYFSGSVEFENESGNKLGTAPLLYLAGTPFDKSANQDPKTKPAEDDRSKVEQLEDTLYDARLKFVREERSNEDEAVQSERSRLIAALQESRPEDPAPVFEEALNKAIASGLASEAWKGLETDEMDEAAAPVIIELLDKARPLTQPDEIALFRGAKKQAAPGDVEARHALELEEKEIDEKAAVLVSIEQLRSDVKLSTEDIDAAREALLEVARWEKEKSETTKQLWASLYQKEGHYALAIESLNSQLKEDPLNEDLLKKRIELYEELGWTRFAETDKNRLAIRSYMKRKLPNAE